MLLEIAGAVVLTFALTKLFERRERREKDAEYDISD